MAVPPPSLHLLVHHLPKHSVPDKLSFLLSHSFTTTMATLNAPHSSLPPPLLHAPTLPPPHIKTHLLGMLYTRSRMHQGSHTSPSLSLHPHSLILSLKHKHCMVGISLNLISFILCHLPRSDINIKYSTSPCTAHCISLYLKQIIFPNSSLSIFFMIQDNFSYKQKNQQKTDEKIDQ